MVDEIVAAMDEIEADESIGAIVVTGAPPAFCAGANLGNLAEADGASLRTIYEGFLRIARSPLPTLAAVNGAAVGAGMNLALGCDVRLAARPGEVRHPLPADRPAPRRRPHVDAAAHRRAAGGDGRGGVRRGARRRRGRAGRPRLPLRRRRPAARRRPGDGRAGGVGAARAGDRHQADDPGDGRHRRARRRRQARARAAGVEHQQPWFAERLAALQARISPSASDVPSEAHSDVTIASLAVPSAAVSGTVRSAHGKLPTPNLAVRQRNNGGTP